MPFFERMLRLLEMQEPIDEYFHRHPGVKESILKEAAQVIQAVQNQDEDAHTELVRCLFLLLEDHFRDPMEKQVWNFEHPFFYNLRHEFMQQWEKGWVSQSMVDFDSIPETPEGFAKWLQRYCQNHRIHSHQLHNFVKEGKLEELRDQVYFSTYFDIVQHDLYATAAIGLPDTSSRIEISKNYWDEMGLGEEDLCHSVWARKFAEAIGMFDDDRTWLQEFTSFPGECLDRFVVSCYVGTSRRNWLKLIGHLGATEIYDPLLNGTFIKNGRQFGLSDDDLEYHFQHIKLDAIHSVDWLNKVVIPIVQVNSDARFEIARGAELNMESFARSYDAILAKKMAERHQTA